MNRLSLRISLLLCAAFPGYALAENSAVKCVQNELNALGYDAGTADGMFGKKSAEASEKYAAEMASKNPGWAMEPLSTSSAALWCEKVADAWPLAAPFFAEYSGAPVAGAADVTFTLKVGGPEGIVFAFVLLRDDAVTFQSEYSTSANPVSFQVDSAVVAASNRFCVVVNPELAHFEDQAGGKFPATCDALTGSAYPAGTTIGYVTTVLAGA